MTWKSRHKTGSPHPQQHRSALRTKPKPRKVSGYISVSFYEYNGGRAFGLAVAVPCSAPTNLDSVAREATLWKRRRCRHPHSTKSECGGMLKVRFKRHSFRRCVGMCIQKRKTCHTICSSSKSFAGDKSMSSRHLEPLGAFIKNNLKATCLP